MTYYQNWKNVPANAWRWPDFSPAEIACRGDGKLLVNEDALDRLQALRTRLGKPMIVNSAYRSPEHNKRVGGAPKSMHLEGRAFDISMANHDPAEFIQAARSVGFAGFGTYPRSNFVHIDTGPARTWGDPFPPRATRFAVEAPAAPDNLAEDRAIKGAGIAGVGTIGVAGAGAAQQTLSDAHGAILPFMPYLADAKWLFVALALAGIAVTVWARYDDWRQGRR